jgi:hypothetical protein
MPFFIRISNWGWAPGLGEFNDSLPPAYSSRRHHKDTARAVWRCHDAQVACQRSLILHGSGVNIPLHAVGRKAINPPPAAAAPVSRHRQSQGAILLEAVALLIKVLTKTLDWLLTPSRRFRILIL